MALEIESIIHENFSGKAYPTEARRILFVLKSILCKKYLIGPLLLRMLFIKLPKKSMQILLKLKNKIKNIKNIILTENDNTQIIRRTHKGKLLKRMILRDQTKLMRVLPQEKLIIVIFLQI